MLTPKSIIASLLVLGSLTSVAAAAPCEETPVRQATVTYQPVDQQPVREQPVREQPVYAQPVYAQPIYQPVSYQPPAQPAPSWPRPIGHGPVRPEREITLKDDTHINAHGYDIVLPSGRDKFRSLTVEAAGGRTKFDKVIVLFADGGRQTVTNPGVVEGDASLTIDLDGARPRAITKIVLFGRDLSPYGGRKSSPPAYAVRGMT